MISMLAGSGTLETLPLDDTSSVWLVLSSVRCNSSSSKHDIPFHDYAGEYIAWINLGITWLLIFFVMIILSETKNLFILITPLLYMYTHMRARVFTLLFYTDLNYYLVVVLLSVCFVSKKWCLTISSVIKKD